MSEGITGKIRMQNNFDCDSDETFEKQLRFAKDVNLYTDNDTEKKKLYFAGPWFDERAKRLYETCYDVIRKLPPKYSKYIPYFPKYAFNSTPAETFKSNVDAINECDVLIALVSRKDVGTAWEIGMAYALKKPIFLLGYDESTFLSHTNVMLAFTGKCITIDKLSKFMFNMLEEDDFVHIKNEWEGIE